MDWGPDHAGASEGFSDIQGQLNQHKHENDARNRENTRRIRNWLLKILANFCLWFWNRARCVVLVYIWPPVGIPLTYLSFQGAMALQHGNGFMSLGLAWGTVDALIFILTALIALATVGGMLWAMYSMYWVDQIIAFFYLYRIEMWAIHQFSAASLADVKEAWVFCFLVSSIIETIAVSKQQRLTRG